MRELALAGVVAILFGLGTFYATDHFGAFSWVNLVGGGLALLLAVALGARRLRFTGGRHAWPVLGRGLGLVLAALALAVGMERVAHRAQVRFDWTFERRYDLAPALVERIQALPGLRIDLVYDALDPRIRRTRLLLEELARHGDVEVASHDFEQLPKDVDEYAIGSSNSLLIRYRGRDEIVERPTQGAIYEALYRLASVDSGVVAMLRGEGEGDPELRTEQGYGGLASMLATEGYEVRSLVTMAMRDVPEDVDVIVALAPRRDLHAPALDAIRRFLARGGGLVALLEPGVHSGLEDVLAEWGLRSPDRVIIDPAHGEGLGGEVEGACPLAFNYETHPVTRGLDRNRMTFFCGARSFELRKVDVNDSLRAVVQTSPRAWLSDDLDVLDRRGKGVEHQGERQDYHPIAVAGRFERGEVETRIFAVGDADFASNRYLRALYNLDLLMNGIHWTAEREARIALRPKIRDTVQFPLPVQDSLGMLYGVGLLVPEALLIVGGVVWLRRRAA
ncbi:MAG: Gldg family protein [Myxococcota bacterium]